MASWVCWEGEAYSCAPSLPNKGTCPTQASRPTCFPNTWLDSSRDGWGWGVGGGIPQAAFFNLERISSCSPALALRGTEGKSLLKTWQQPWPCSLCAWRVTESFPAAKGSVSLWRRKEGSTQGQNLWTPLFFFGILVPKCCLERLAGLHPAFQATDRSGRQVIRNRGAAGSSG